MKTIVMFMLGALTSNVTSTEIANQVELSLQKNRDAYWASERTLVGQKAAIDYFNAQWAWLQSSSGCGSAVLGASGRRCISERKRDGKWPWEVYYLDTLK